MINSAITIDENLKIRCADPKVFDYIGSSNFGPLYKAIHEEDLPRFRHELSKLADSGELITLFRLRNNEGWYNWIYAKGRYSRQDDDNTRVFSMTLSDITATTANIDRIEFLNERYRRMLGYHRNIFFEYYPENKKIKFFCIQNDTEHIIFEALLDVWRDKLISEELISEQSQDSFEMLCKSISGEEKCFEHELYSRYLTPNGEWAECRFIGGTVFCTSHNSVVSGTIIAASTEKISLSEFSAADTDAMTGALNKSAIKRYIAAQLKNIGIKTLSVVLIDLDNFKEINDTFGHLYGDKILMRFMNTLTSRIKDDGVIGRFGGDEFIAVFTDLEDNEQLRSYLRSVKMSVEEEFSDLDEGFSITCSMGAVMYPYVHTDCDGLLQLADSCMYLAKNKGKNRYIIYDKEAHKSFDTSVSEYNSHRTSEDQTGFISGIAHMLFDSPRDDLEYVLQRICNHYSLNSVKIYAGENMTRKLATGINTELAVSGDYIFMDGYLKAFHQKKHLAFNNITDIECRMQEVGNILVKQKVSSAVQHIIGNADDVKGFISFEMTGKGRCWSNTEIDGMKLLGTLIEQYIQTRKPELLN